MAVELLIKITKLHLILDIFYFFTVPLAVPISAIIDDIKLNRHEKSWAKISYVVICLSAFFVSIFTVAANLAYHTKAALLHPIDAG